MPAGPLLLRLSQLRLRLRRRPVLRVVLRQLLTGPGRLALVAPATLALACHGGAPETAPPPDAPAVVEVENLTATDVTVYAVSGGERVRLGLATASSRKAFPLPAHLARRTHPLRFLADPVGGSPYPVGDEIVVSPGDTVVVSISP